MNITLHKIFNIEECERLAITICSSPQLRPEDNNKLYFNSKGIYNLAEAAVYIPRLELAINKQFGDDICFANTYSRIYQKNSILGIHTDRPGLDITASICIQKDSKEPWPLIISKKPWEGLWRTNEDYGPWLAEFNEYNLEPGDAVICEGLIYPHWRQTLDCEDNEKNIYIFYHWTRLNHVA